MIISADPKSRFHADVALKARQGLKPEVYLDGRPITDVTFASEEAGAVTVHKMGDDGSFVLDKTRQRIETRHLFGKVKIEWVRE